VDQNCEEEIFPLSVIYFDQVVSVSSVRKTSLQLFASACMLVASKFRETNHLSSQILVMYTDRSITVNQLLVLYFIVFILFIYLSQARSIHRKLAFVQKQREHHTHTHIQKVTDIKCCKDVQSVAFSVCCCCQTCTDAPMHASNYLIKLSSF